MAVLTPEQRAFLKSQKIVLTDLFDATGMRKKDYQAEMDRQEKIFAFGVTPCKEAGHTIRTKSGHCIQCNTKTIAFAIRSSKPGIVYIAGSLSGNLLKVGCTSDISRRSAVLIAEEYGGVSDWEMLAHVHVEKNAGKVEFDIHEKLSAYNVNGHYMKNGKRTQCYELFKCSYKRAKSAFIDALPLNATPIFDNETRILTVYTFGV